MIQVDPGPPDQAVVPPDNLHFAGAYQAGIPEVVVGAEPVLSAAPVAATWDPGVVH